MTAIVFQVDPFEPWLPYDYERERMAAAGGRLVLGNCRSAADVVAQAQGAEVLLVSGGPRVTAAMMDALPTCRLVMRWGVGFDIIDVAAATARGVAVANCPTYATQYVAEHALALLLDCARHVTWFTAQMRQGRWLPARARPTPAIQGSTLGIIGIGRIGSALAWRARGIGMRVLAHDPYLADETVRARQAEPRALDALLAESDFISVHVPLNAETRRLVNAGVFKRMKRGAILLNTSRGPVVDQDALVGALSSGQVASAGLDVFEEEPLPEDHPLRFMERVLLTPHTAAYSEESWGAIRAEACNTVSDWLRTGWAATVVNPEVRERLRARR